MGQVTELKSQVQEFEKARAVARQEHAELAEQYKVELGQWGKGPGCLLGVQNLNPQMKTVKGRC